MRAITIYESFDGYRFDTPEECLGHEKAQKAMSEASNNLAKKMLDKFYPGESAEKFQPVSPTSIIQLRNGSALLKGLAISIIADGKVTGRDELENMYRGSNAEFCVIFDSVEGDFRTTKFRTFEQKWGLTLSYGGNGRSIAEGIDFSLFPIDVAVLAKIHQSGKNRKKIESVLVNCQCVGIASDFRAKKYDKYLKVG